MRPEKGFTLVRSRWPNHHSNPRTQAADFYYWTKSPNTVEDDTGLRIRMSALLKAHDQERLTWLLSLRLPLPVHRRPQ